MSDTVVVFGAAGMFGTECMARLREKTNWDIVALDRDMCDVTNDVAVYDAIATHEPLAVINAAAQIKLEWCEQHPDGARAINTEGMRHIAAAVASRTQPTQTFQISTCYVFDDEKKEYTEADEPHPMQVYGQTKLESEHALADTLLHTQHPYFIFRTSWTYSATKRTWIDDAIAAAQRGEPMQLVSDQHNTVTRCRDLTDTIIDFILHRRREHSGVYHVAATSAEPLTKYDIGRFCVKMLGLNEEYIQPMSSTQFSVPRPMSARLVTVRDVNLPDCFTSLKTYLNEQYVTGRL